MFLPQIPVALYPYISDHTITKSNRIFSTGIPAIEILHQNEKSRLSILIGLSDITRSSQKGENCILR